MAEHLGEMRLPAWRSKRWQDFHTLHIWLGKHSCCLIQANQILRWHQQTEPIQPETVVELLKGQQDKRCRLLLELPWIWLEAAETISIRTEEWPFYLRHHLQLPELPVPQQPVGWQHLKGSPPKNSPGPTQSTGSRVTTLALTRTITPTTSPASTTTIVSDPIHRRRLASQKPGADYDPSLECWKPAKTLVATSVGTSNRGTLAGRPA